jgi:hypothetical protein
VATVFGALGCGGGVDAVDDTETAFERVTVVRYPGGFGGAPAAVESTCDPHAYLDTLTADASSGELSWDRCHFEPPSLYSVQQGQRVLTAAELDSVEQTLARLEAGTPEAMCGADAGFLTLDIQKMASTELYISSSSCPAEASAGRTPADGISDLWLRMSELSGE